MLFSMTNSEDFIHIYFSYDDILTLFFNMFTILLLIKENIVSFDGTIKIIDIWYLSSGAQNDAFHPECSQDQVQVGGG